MSLVWYLDFTFFKHSTSLSTTGTNKPHYVALSLPLEMQGPFTRVRWWQPPNHDGSYDEEWAIDQVIFTNQLFCSVNDNKCTCICLSTQ